MKKSFLFLSFLFFISPFTFAGNGGGTVVGNGAGIVESDFQEAYTNLPKLIASCKLSILCQVDEEDQKTLDAIETIAAANMKKKDRLLYVSEREHPGFFTTGNFENHRIAKTGLTPESPIYINRDLLYNQHGRPAIAYAAIVRILVHEIGHQSGVLHHEELDMLGAKLGDFAGQKTSVYNYRSEEDDKEVSFSVTNLETPYKEVVLIARMNNKKSENLSEALLRAAVCPGNNQIPAGLSASNCHFTFDAFGRLTFKGWVRIYCIGRDTSAIANYHKEMSVELNESLDPIGLFIY